MERISFVSFVSLQGGEVGSFPGPGKAELARIASAWLVCPPALEADGVLGGFPGDFKSWEAALEPRWGRFGTEDCLL